MSEGGGLEELEDRYLSLMTQGLLTLSESDRSGARLSSGRIHNARRLVLAHKVERMHTRARVHGARWPLCRARARYGHSNARARVCEPPK